MADYTNTLESLSEELEQIEIQITELSGRRDALTQAIRGLSILSGEAARAAGPVSSAVDAMISKRALDVAMRCLEASKTPLRAADIKSRLGIDIPEVSYQSIYRALTRESNREGGAVFKDGEKFGLRKWKERQIGPKPKK